METTLQQTHSAVAVYADHESAEAALKELKAKGFDMKNLSIIGKDFQTEENAVGFYNTGDRMKFWGKRGAFWGGLWGWLVGAGLFLIPGVGHVIVLGPLVGWIVGALEGAAVGGSLGVLGAALASAGIPKDSVVQYETAVRAGQFVVTLRGSADEVARAQTILSGRGLLKSAVYPAQ
jgi:hypothetical protein